MNNVLLCVPDIAWTYVHWNLLLNWNSALTVLSFCYLLNLATLRKSEGTFQWINPPYCLFACGPQAFIHLSVQEKITWQFPFPGCLTRSFSQVARQVRDQDECMKADFANALKLVCVGLSSSPLLRRKFNPDLNSSPYQLHLIDHPHYL